LPVVHVVKLGRITGMNLDLLVAFLLAKILWPWNVPKIVFEAALFDPVNGSPGLRSSPNGYECLSGACRTREDKQR